MAAPSYATNLADITTAESTTNWSALGGGASGLSASPDIAVQGTNCVDKQVTSAEKGQVFDNGATITPGSAEHFYIWIAITTPGLIDTYANRGLTAVLGTSTTAYNKFHLTGSDQFRLAESFYCWPIRYVNTSNGSAPQRTLVGSPGANPQWFGAMTNITASVKGANLGVDVIRRGNSVTVTDGDSGTPATWSAFAAYANDTTRRWGIIAPSGNGAQVQGLAIWGSGGTAVYGRDSNVGVVFLAVPHALSTLNGIEFNNASTDVVFDNVGVTALGTNSRGTIVVNNNAAVTWTNSVFQGIDTTTLGGTNSVFDGSKWVGCNAVTAAGASMLGCSFVAPTVSADTSPLIWNVATDPDGYLADGEFVSHPTTAHHAIELGTSSPTSVTLRGVTFTDFNASDGQNDSAIHVKRTSGTVTINIVGGSGTPSYKSDGATVTIVSNPVTLTVHVEDITDFTNIENARVYVEADTGGPLSAGTVIINALTSAAGDASDTRTYASDQPITGWVRRATSGFGTLYKEAAITGSIDSANGATVNVLMVPDE